MQSAPAMVRWLHQAARFFTILCPLLILAGPAPADIAVCIISLLFLAHSALARDWQWLRVRWVQLLLLLWAYMCLRNLFLPELDGVLRSASWLRYPLFAAAMAFWILPDATARDWLRKTLLVTVALLAVDTLWQYAFGFDVTGRPSFPYQNSLRLTGPYSNPRVGITLLWLMFPVIFWCVAQRNVKTRTLGVLLTVLTALAVFTSGERMALLLTGMGFVLAFALMPRMRLMLLAGAVAAVCLGWGLTHSNPKLEARQVDATQKEVGRFGDSAYGQTWTSSLRIAAEHPLFGVGSKQFKPTCVQPIYGATNKKGLLMRCPMHPHNMYLEWLVEYGVIGLALFLAVLANWAGLVFTQRHTWWKEPVATGLLVTMVLRLWPISVVTSQFVSWSAVPFWLLAGWLLAVLFTGKSAGDHNNA